MEWIGTFIKEIYTYLGHRDDTRIDRLNRLYTVALLSVSVTLITSQQFVVGERIICWTPKDFTGAQDTFAQDICWLGHTNYYVSENSTILETPSSPRTYPFTIYPWLPLVLIGMTVSFAVPYLLIWHGLSTRTGININRLLKIKKQDELTQAIRYILCKNYSYKCSAPIYVTSIYLLMRILYIIILFSQIFFINKLLTGLYFQFNFKNPWEILSIKYNMWSSAHFPIETMCDFMIRMLGQNNNWYTVQCILPFNLFTKRIFAFLFIWFIILLIINVIDFIFVWLCQRIYSNSYRYEYIFRFFHLYQLYLYKNEITREIMFASKAEIFRHEFVYNYLGLDGYLVLKFLNGISTDMDMSYLIAKLFEGFLKMKLQSNRQQPIEVENNIV
ncbi:hypothetical protein I4U23_009309 [Adineta vaga]|nr:hypothetical protein I4U23_009309 [Adineta vaga]